MKVKTVRFDLVPTIKYYELNQLECSEKRIHWKVIKIKIPLVMYIENIKQQISGK